MQSVSTSNLFKISAIANTFEWYEFIVYAYLSGIIGIVFFEKTSPASTLIQSFSLLAFSYLARPLGSYYFGQLSDRMGRSHALKRSLLMMSVPTALIGLLPTYKQAGYLATGLLLLLRMIQGFSVGGEQAANGCYVFENSPANKKGIFCSIVQASALMGTLLGSGIVYLLFRYFEYATIINGGWRIPFLLGVPMTLFIAYLRKAITWTESHLAKKVVLKPELKKLWSALLLVAFSQASLYANFIWMPTYLVYFLGYSDQLAYFSNTLALFVMVFFYLLSGICSRYVGYQRLSLIGLMGFILCIYPLFKALQIDSTSSNIVLAIQLFMALIQSTINSTIIEFLGGIFPAGVRGLGMSLAYTLPAVFVGGITPLVCTYIIHKTGWLMFPAFYIMFFGLLALPVALRLKASSDE